MLNQIIISYYYNYLLQPAFFSAIRPIPPVRRLFVGHTNSIEGDSEPKPFEA